MSEEILQTWIRFILFFFFSVSFGKNARICH